MSEQAISSADDIILELDIGSELELLSAELTSLKALESTLLNSELALERTLDASELTLEIALETCELTLDTALLTWELTLDTSLLRLESVLLRAELVLTSALTSALTSPLVSTDWASAAVAIPMPAAMTTAITELGFMGCILVCDDCRRGNALGQGDTELS